MHAIEKRGRSSLKAQMTIFFIVGIIVLLVFAFFMMFVQSITQARVRVEAKKALNSFIETSTINQYVSSCMDSVLSDGLQKAALQGGIIYDYQIYPLVDIGDEGGVTPPNNGQNNRNTPGNMVVDEDLHFLEIDVSNLNIIDNPYAVSQNSEFDEIKFSNVSYGLNIADTNGIYPPYQPDSKQLAPSYPKEAPGYFLTQDLFLQSINGFQLWPTFQMSEGFYGQLNYPKLCDDFALCSYKSTHEIYNSLALRSLESQLEEYVAQRTRDCVNFTYFEELTPYNITDNEITANVVFSIDQVNLKIHYPLTIVWKNGEPITEEFEFSIKKQARVERIYELIYSLLKYESFDLFFDVLDYKSIDLGSKLKCILRDGTRCFDDDVEVYKIRNVESKSELGEFVEQYDDLVVIKDLATIINGKPLMYLFLIENRRPALDFINNYVSEELNFVVFEEKAIELNPIGYDPDDDSLNYEYSGWMQDYYEEFDFDRYESDQSNGHVSDHPYLEYRGDSIDLTGINDPDNRKRWMDSSPFLETSRDAIYVTQHKDLGYHETKIKIFDETGLEDFQILKILVRDFPTAYAESSNDYDDIHNDFASVEDPYNLDASFSYVIISDPLDPNNDVWYRWHEDFDPYTTLGTQEQITILPDVPFTIMDVHNHYFLKSSLLVHPEYDVNNPSAVPTTITLESGLDLGDGNGPIYGQSENSVDTKDIFVFECLPHEGDGTNLPFPYAPNSDATPFNTNHVCCIGDPLAATPENIPSGWGSVADDDLICFTKDQYAAYPYFQKTQNLNYWYDNYQPQNDLGFAHTHNLPTPSTSILNDILLRKFERNCDGLRGNICAGNGESDFEVLASCPEFSTLNAQCVGPTANLFNFAYDYDSSNPAPVCTTYNPGESFEIVSGLGSILDKSSCRPQLTCYASDNRNFANGNSYATAFSLTSSSNPVSAVGCVNALCGGSNPDANLQTQFCNYFAQDSDCACSDQCGAHPSCYGVDPLEPWNGLSSPSNRGSQGCDLNCNYHSCNNFAFDISGTGECFDTCSNDYQCADGFNCDIDDESYCVICNFNSHIQTDGSSAGKCELACGADNACDEQSIGVAFGSSNLEMCSSTCDYVVCSPNTIPTFSSQGTVECVPIVSE
jgi:hypothetical protein